MGDWLRDKIEKGKGRWQGKNRKEGRNDLSRGSEQNKTELEP